MSLAVKPKQPEAPQERHVPGIAGTFRPAGAREILNIGFYKHLAPTELMGGGPNLNSMAVGHRPVPPGDPPAPPVLKHTKVGAPIGCGHAGPSAAWFDISLRSHPLSRASRR